jgi:hypothetical protein
MLRTFLRPFYVSLRCKSKARALRSDIGFAGATLRTRMVSEKILIRILKTIFFSFLKVYGCMKGLLFCELQFWDSKLNYVYQYWLIINADKDDSDSNYQRRDQHG